MRLISTYPFGLDWASPAPDATTKVGIVMRTRDRPLLLPRALASVAGQTFDDWHLVVVNHGGDPKPVEAAVAEVMSEARGKVEVVHLDPAGGMERASNAGLRRLDAEFFVIHDDDDTWLPEFLARTVAFLDDPSNRTCGAVTTHATKRWERIDDGRIETVEDEDLNSEERFVDAQELFGWNRVYTINTLLRSALLDVVGAYNEQLDVVGDWEFHMRVAAVTEIGLIPEVLARYHLRHLGGQAEYDNTVVEGWTAHREMDARLRGAMIRRYLDADPSRFGLVVALAHDAEMARVRLGRIEETVRLIDWRTHHTGERINDMHDRVLVDVQHSLDQLRSEIAAVRADVERGRPTLDALGAALQPFRSVRNRWRARRRRRPAS